ncbi:MAG: hypothetical protein ACF8QF_05240 [Phycisphaerales bacterium]
MSPAAPGRASRASGALATAVGAALALPLVFGVVNGLGAPAETLRLVARDTVASLPTLARSVGVCVLAGALATALALPAAWWSRRLGAAGAALLFAPMLLPGYLVYTSWGLLRAPGTALGDWIAHAPAWASRVVSWAQAIGGVALWSWPIAAVVMALGARAIEQERLDWLRMECPSRLMRVRHGARMLAPSMCAAVGLVGLVTLGSSVPLHVAQVETYAITLWRLLDETGGSGAVWVAATPLLALAIVGGWITGGRVSRMDLTRAARRESEGAGPPVVVAASLVWGLSTLAPIALLALSLRDAGSLGRFLQTAGDAILSSALMAIAAGVMALGLGALASVAAQRRGASLAARVWIALGLAPGVLIGASLLRAGDLPGLGWLAESRAGVSLAHLARFGLVAVCIACAVQAAEPRELRDLRRLEAGAGLGAWWRTRAVAHAPALAGAAMAVALLSLHEIEAAVVLLPPGTDNLPRFLLNLLHYNREEELVAGMLVVAGGGLAFALLVAGVLGLSGRLGRRGLLALIALTPAALLGCQDRAPEGGAPLDVVRVIGEPGRHPGQFVQPRAIDIGMDSLFIIDRSGRAQRLTLDGAPLAVWELPAVDRGFPTGLTFGPDGLLYIADTHEHRVAVFRPTDEGAELIATHGAYGTGDGEFIYPTDVAIETDPDGAIERFYVGEYGGNDRISVFDDAWTFLFAFGSLGSADEPGAVFERPQSLVYDSAREELLVTDSIHHRVGRFTRDGELIAWHGLDGGAPGGAPGAFRYPYSLAPMPDGSVLVGEFGNNRVQRIDWETGASLGVYGRPGRGEGELAQPWGVAFGGDVAYVVDARNHRAIAFRAPVDRRLARSGGQSE